MSTETEGDGEESQPHPSNISLTYDESGEWWVARDEDTGVASQGKMRQAALKMLDEAVALHRGEAGEPVTDEDLRDLGIDPDSVPDGVGVPDASWFDGEE
jgi:predicted RNase H-like HicB family nuclease